MGSILPRCITCADRYIAPNTVLNWFKFDHFAFPGAVPRTFIGSVLLAWLSTPVIQLASWLGYVHTKFDLQIIGDFHDYPTTYLS